MTYRTGEGCRRVGRWSYLGMQQTSLTHLRRVPVHRGGQVSGSGIHVLPAPYHTIRHILYDSGIGYDGVRPQ